MKPKIRIGKYRITRSYLSCYDVKNLLSKTGYYDDYFRISCSIHEKTINRINTLFHNSFDRMSALGSIKLQITNTIISNRLVNLKLLKSLNYQKESKNYKA